MDDISIFPDKNSKPTDNELATKLGTTIALWLEINKLVYDKYPGGISEWNYPGQKYGWSFRIKDKKRAIIYFLPRENYFKVAFVFGQKAYDKIMESDIDTSIKEELQNAKKYAEGRGIRIDIKNADMLSDIKQLIQIKLDN